jgi:hypothetical protein
MSSKPTILSHLLLSHLSRDNNCPDLVLELFKRSAGDTEIVVASRERETEVYYINSVKNGKSKVEGCRAETLPIVVSAQENMQYSLF